MNNSFNPSLGAKMKQFPKTDFGLVVSMPFLPKASAEFHSRPVFNQEDGCIYYSILDTDKTTWIWKQATDGSFRQYLFSTLPVLDDQVIISYVATTDTAPQPGKHYYTKSNSGRYVRFTESTFVTGTTYYVLSIVTRGVVFNDVVATINSLLVEFKRWGVEFVNAPVSGEIDIPADSYEANVTYRDMVLLLNEMITHVNRYSNRKLEPYSADRAGNITTIDPTTTVMDDLNDHVNNLISAVNPYIDVLTDIQRALASVITETAQEANS